MDLGKKATVVFFTLMAVSGVSLSSFVHRVGDRQGWAANRGVDYTRWAQARKFHVGDIIHFWYDRRFHNVLQVSRSDLHTCNTTCPIAKYTGGNDYIRINSRGHYFFICGFPNHCANADQKVDIRVPY